MDEAAALSSRQHSDRPHAAGFPLFRPIGKIPVRVACRAGSAVEEGAHPRAPSLLPDLPRKIDFIMGGTDAGADLNDQPFGRGGPPASEAFDRLEDDPGFATPPAGMDEADRGNLRVEEVDGGAVGYAYLERDSSAFGKKAVDAGVVPACGVLDEGDLPAVGLLGFNNAFGIDAQLGDRRSSVDQAGP